MSPGTLLKSSLIAAAIFGLLGTVVALWENPWFIRMTPTDGFEVALLALQSILLGVYFAIPAPACAVKLAGIGGVANFLGIACPICNKLLMLVFSADVLLAYLEPARIYLASAGVLITGFAVLIRWRRFQAGAAEMARSPSPIGSS